VDVDAFFTLNPVDMYDLTNTFSSTIVSTDVNYWKTPTYMVNVEDSKSAVSAHRLYIVQMIWSVLWLLRYGVYFRVKELDI
jgi:hypothetical protein